MNEHATPGISRNAYIVRRLGLRSSDVRGLDKQQRMRVLLSRALLRPFTAPSFAHFWRYWNPVYGYYLGKYVYRPSRRVLPHSLSVLVTFAFCGFFLHDILGWPASIALGGGVVPPHNVTVWFCLIAVGIGVADQLGLRFDALRTEMRAGLHVSFLAAMYLLMRLIV